MTAIPAWLQILIGVSNAVVLLLLCVLMLMAIPAVIALRRVAGDASRRLDTLGNRIRDEFGPVMKDAATLVTDLKSIAVTVHDDAQAVHAVVTSTTKRVERLTETIEDRLGRLGALADVAQDEAEHIVLSAAAAARGLRGMSGIWRHLLGSMWPSHSDSDQEPQHGTQHRYSRDEERDQERRPRIRPRQAAPTQRNGAPPE